MASGDRVVLNGNTTGFQNGVWVWNGASTPMTRATDCSTGGTGSTGVLGMTIAIEEGTYADQIWILTNNAPITIGTTSLTFAKSSATTYTASNGISLSGNNFTFDYTYFSGEASITSLGAISLSNAAVIGKVLTGFSSGAGTVSSTDSILQAIQKLDGNNQLKELLTNKASDFSTINNTKYPTTKAVDDNYWSQSADEVELAIVNSYATITRI
jgi:hypothetical protein